MIKLIGFIFALLFLTSCYSLETDKPEEAFKYWSGQNPPKEIRVLEGKYFQSPHFFLEYELFLKLEVEKDWRIEFIEYNKLKIDTLKVDWKFTEFPEWFEPTPDFIIYSKNDKFDNSRYFFNRKTRICYLYETVGM